MARFVDALSIVLLLVACAAFVLGLRALADKDDLRAFYHLIVGAIALKSATDLLRPRGT